MVCCVQPQAHNKIRPTEKKIKNYRHESWVMGDMPNQVNDTNGQRPYKKTIQILIYNNNNNKTVRLTCNASPGRTTLMHLSFIIYNL